MSFNLQWMERYSNPFGLSSLLKPYGLFSPMWGLSDEITMSLVGNEPGDFEWEAAHTKIFQHSYSRSLAMDNSTRQILDRAQLDVNNSGIEARKLLLLSVPCLPHLLWHTTWNSFMKNGSLISCFCASQVEVVSQCGFNSCFNQVYRSDVFCPVVLYTNPSRAGCVFIHLQLATFLSLYMKTTVKMTRNV